MLRKFVALAALSFVLAGWATADDRHEREKVKIEKVKIMTQNMDDGTDQTYVIAALTGQLPIPVPSAVDLTFLELQASNFEGRAKALARRIAHEKPDILALQEAALWRFQPTGGPELVLYDNLDLLRAALKKLGVPYDKVAEISLTDLALDGDQIGGALRWTDRNAVLVRSDLKRPNFYLSNVHARTFDAAFPFPVSPDLTLMITAGWISADVHIGDERFRFVTTHLESPIATIPEATDVQVAQAQELINALSDTRMPIVICGDFNSDATRGGGVEDTGTFHFFETAGYAEAWPVTHRKRDLGLTWPIFLEDQFPGGGLPPPFFAASQPTERIDLFFSKGMDVVSSELVLAPVPGSFTPPLFDTPPFGSDHAGVIAIFRP
jgi:endonuclease/exonuclease/phosphatase family metal-dependent hydrolase